MSNVTSSRLAVALCAALAAGGASVARAEIGFKAGAWDLSFSGNVNGFLTYNDCDSNLGVAVRGGLVCQQSLNGDVDETAIESGLLPSALVFGAKTTQRNFDIGVTLGFYPGIVSSATGQRGIGASSIDMRQNFLTFGQKSWGTVKIGRDIGLFGGDAILADMTLLGVGSGGAFLGGNTTLGRIGIGYIYTDWIPQITYMSPKMMGGFEFAAGVFQGVDVFPFSGHPNSAALTAHEQPGFQAKASYGGNWGGVDGKVWASTMFQKVKARSTDAAPAGAEVKGTAFDVGIKAGFGGFEGVLYGYTAEGVGTTAIGFDAASFAGGTLARRDSEGFYVQGTYKFGNFKPGISYGESRLDLASNETAALASSGALVKKNKSLVLGLYYSLTDSLSLVGEYIKTEADNHAGQKAEDDAIAIGAILFF